MKAPRRYEQHDQHVLSFICNGSPMDFYRWLLHSLGVDEVKVREVKQNEFYLQKLLPAFWQ